MPKRLTFYVINTENLENLTKNTLLNQKTMLYYLT